ncbi:MAG: hypothetical protein JSV30_03405 [Candidatus Omnitrophota bacterium]|nr:MAG: hypothetical protein JSV30_03405 [Candidatus Omnitrophota bacterium]
MKKILAYLTGVLFGAIGAGFGAVTMTVALCWIFGGKERAIRFLTSASAKGGGTIEWIGIVLGVILGISLGVALWGFIMWKTGWLTIDEIMRFIDKKWKG